jgi:hypothetical protein
MSANSRANRRNRLRVARLAPPAPPNRCTHCLWLPDCLALHRPLPPDCDAFCAGFSSTTPRSAEGDLQQVLEHDVNEVQQ